jgi:hypothetical protein
MNKLYMYCVSGSYIQKLAHMLHLPECESEEGWSAQRESNILALLKVSNFK